ncbi:MAG: META domain-containing protein [Methyloceanibacter sp.]|uniref:META domain-containing protein n=1 Tax=Methyloceanibacter sp. TaxID=1965321 RepID=UPI003D6D0650
MLPIALALAIGSMGLTTTETPAGSRWHPSLIHSFAVPAEERVFVTFHANGRVTGNGGCNQFFGGYKIAGDTVRIGPLASTKKGCPGKYELETTFLSTLQAAATFRREGASLVLFDAGGQEIARLVEVDGA